MSLVLKSSDIFLTSASPSLFIRSCIAYLYTETVISDFEPKSTHFEPLHWLLFVQIVGFQLPATYGVTSDLLAFSPCSLSYCCLCALSAAESCSFAAFF